MDSFVNVTGSNTQLGEAGKNEKSASDPFEMVIGPILKIVGNPLDEHRFCATTVAEKAFSIGGNNGEYVKSTPQDESKKVCGINVSFTVVKITEGVPSEKFTV